MCAISNFCNRVGSVIQAAKRNVSITAAHYSFIFVVSAFVADIESADRGIALQSQCGISGIFLVKTDFNHS